MNKGPTQTPVPQTWAKLGSKLGNADPMSRDRERRRGRKRGEQAALKKGGRLPNRERKEDSAGILPPRAPQFACYRLGETRMFVETGNAGIVPRNRTNWATKPCRLRSQNIMKCQTSKYFGNGVTWEIPARSHVTVTCGSRPKRSQAAPPECAHRRAQEAAAFA